MTNVSNKLLEKVIEDIKANPDRVDQYLQVLAKKGLLKDIKTLRLKKCSAKLLKELEGQNVTIIIK